MLSAADLATLRAAQAAALPDLATVQTKNPTDDGYGRKTFSYVNGAVIACRLGPSEQVEMPQPDGGLKYDTQAWVTVAQATTIALDARLVINDHTYEVIAVATTAAWETANRVRVRELKAKAS